MTSEIRANTLKNRVGLGTVSFTNTGPVISGVTTIASGGKLSIGGVVPTELLHIADAGNPYILIEDTDANNQVGIKFKTTNYDWIAGLHGGIDSFKISQYTAFGTNDHFTINGAGNVFIEKDLDVDGHTNLDNVSIAGVTTITGSGSSVLFLESSNPMIRLTDTDNSAYSSIGGESGNLYLYTNSSSRDFIFRGSAEVARITGDGLLGIGTHTPTASIHLHKASGDAIQKIESSNGAASLELRHTNGYGYINYRQDGAETFRVGQIAQFTSYSVYNPNSSLPYQLCVEGNGEVGINTHNPGNTLHLLRNTNHGISLQKGGTNPGSALIQVASYGALNLEASNNLTLQSGGSQQIFFNRGGTTVAKFDTSGRFGINQSTPASRLHISEVGSNTITIQLTNATTGHTAGQDGMTMGYSTNSTAGFINVCESGSDFTIKTGGTAAGNERLRIASDGKVGINIAGSDNTSPVRNLDIADSSGAILRLISTDDSLGANERLGEIEFYTDDDDGGHIGAFVKAIADPSDSFGRRTALTFGTQSIEAGNAVEIVRIDANGRLLVGTTSNVAGGAINSKIQVRSASYDAAIAIVANRSNTAGGNLSFTKTRGTSEGDTTIVQSGDALGTINFFGADGTADEANAASIYASVDGTPGTNDMPGRLIFATTADGAASPTERLRITSGGNIKQNLTSPSGTSPFQNSHWYDRDGGNYTLTYTDHNSLNAVRTSSGGQYSKLIYKRVRMSKNCDIEFELSGNSPSSTYRHVGFILNGDGTTAPYDRLVFRSRPGNTNSNQIRIDKIDSSGNHTGYGFDESGSNIPTFFDGTERHILIQLRDRLVNVIVDGVVIISQKTNADFANSIGWFGFSIYEGGENASVTIRNLTIKNKFQRPHWLIRASGVNASVSNQNAFPFNQIILASSDMSNSSHYNTSSYRYNVPISGLYYCFLRVYRNGGSGTEVAFYVNGSVRNRFRPQPSSGDYIFAGSCLIQLFKGEYIDVRAFNGSFSHFYGNSNQQFSSWGGHLLD